ncbi:dipeptide ABC transporter ATP-binding protein [Gemmobacter serpentinus]|uniref:dipeptide ABC transporter ATP-binding protein n=1 Tax=Gemmobacter serpentinus TaxID=2652247 RepID=UPI00124CA73E|nr:ABC transporter ATP-binding protein [Gemmobacter serpentinus]
MTGPLIEVDNLSLSVAHRPEFIIVRDVSFALQPGEILGIVGESGSGKTMVARSLMGLQPQGIVVSEGDIRFNGVSVPGMAPAALRKLRGAQIGMVFQEPMTSLNPSMTIGAQLEEPLKLHTKLNRTQRLAKMVTILKRVGIDDTAQALKAHPHQFSGGMRQRIMLASAMLLKPALLIADEPTTALDALVQREVMELMVEMVRQDQSAMLLISHDLPMVARYCDRVIVMRQGDMVEEGPVDRVISAPTHDYTRDLLQSLPLRGPARELAAAPQPMIEVRALTVDYRGRGGLLGRGALKRALHPVDLAVWPGEVVAVVGASGSGKTTLGRAIAGLVPASGGQILYQGQPVARNAAYRHNCQMVFQDPFGSLDPRMSIRQLVGEALRHDGLDRGEVTARVTAMLEEVGLGAAFLDRFPHELSGGQRQRVAIARAIIRNPKFIIADEAVSALDVTVRARVLDLLSDLQRRYGFACLFISHDLGVVEQMADRVVVMRDGRIVEQGPRDAIFDAPTTDYTRALLSAIPTFERTETGVSLNWRFASAGENASQDKAPI